MSSYSTTSLRNFQDPGVVWQSNSVILAFVGGLLVGIVVLVRYLVIGKITGISGFLSRSINPTSSLILKDRFIQNLPYIGGLVAAGGISHVYLPDCFEDWSSLPTARLVLGGIIVGFGTVLGSGCTSGHGISSLSSFRLRGLVATCCFMLSAFVTTMSAGTGTYLPFFNNTLPVERSGAVVGVCIGACVLFALAAAAPIVKSQPQVNLAFKFTFDVSCGIVFGLAMAVTNMTKLSATISFLDLRYWNPALAFVMGGGIFICATGFLAVNAAFKAPLLAKEFWKPELINPDARLVVGSLIFGVGWGLAGACPGPALVNLGSTNIPPLIYNACLVFGMLLEQLVDPYLPGPLAPPAAGLSTKSGMDATSVQADALSAIDDCCTPGETDKSAA